MIEYSVRQGNHSRDGQQGSLMNQPVDVNAAETLFQAFGDPRDLQMEPDKIKAGDYAVIGQGERIGGIWILRFKDGQVPTTALDGTVITGRYFFAAHPVTKKVDPERGWKLLESSLGERFTFRKELGKEMDGYHLPFYVLVAK